MKFNIILLLAGFSSLCHSSPPAVWAIPGAVVVEDQGHQYKCALPNSLHTVRLSSDGQVVIFPPFGYSVVSEIKSCARGKVRVINTSNGVGDLWDVNLRGNIYIALDPISTSPLSYLAVVAHIGKKKNLVSLKGSYRSGVPHSVLQEEGFTIHDEKPPRISVDGKYVAPSGEVDCSTDAFPGVWNIAANKRVIFDGQSGEIECKALFAQPD